MFGERDAVELTRFRDRFPRPSFMTLTVALALVVTPTVGLCDAHVGARAICRAFSGPRRSTKPFFAL
jgi:hypothetical protein